MALLVSGLEPVECGVVMPRDSERRCDHRMMHTSLGCLRAQLAQKLFGLAFVSSARDNASQPSLRALRAPGMRDGVFICTSCFVKVPGQFSHETQPFIRQEEVRIDLEGLPVQ